MHLVHGTRRATRAACIEPLELRRLLAATLDPSFGGGDGYSVLPLDFNHFVKEEAGENIWAYMLVQTMGQLGDGYFVSGQYQYLEQPGEGLPGYVNEVIQTLVAGDGSPRGGLEGDDDSNGVVRYPDFMYEGRQLPYKAFSHSVRAHDGALLVSPGFTPTQTLHDIGRLAPDGSFDENFGVVTEGLFKDYIVLDGNLGVGYRLVNRSDVPPGEDDQFSERVPALFLFDTLTGELIGEPIRPYGDWLTEDEMQVSPGFDRLLALGNDGKLYFGLPVDRLDSDDPNSGSAMLLARFTVDGTSLQLDQSYGSTDLPGQPIPAAYIPVSVRRPVVLGATAEGGAWIKVPNPDGLEPYLDAYARLTPDGALDPTFGDGGNVVIDFPASEPGNTGAGAPYFGNAPRRSFIRDDGSLVAAVGITYDPTQPFNFNLGVYGVMPDGNYDPRIAPAGSEHGVGRAVITREIARPGDSGCVYNGAVILDDQQRLVFAVAIHNYSESDPHEDRTIPVDLAVGRLIISGAGDDGGGDDGGGDDGGGDDGGGDNGGGDDGGGGDPQPTFSFNQQSGRLLVNGTSGTDRLAVRLQDGKIRILSGDGFSTLLTEQDAAAVQFVEVQGFGGADDLRSEVGESFGGFVTLLGGAGNDSLTGDGRYDRLIGDDGDDSIVGGNGPQLLRGGRGNDTLIGGGGRDALFGAEGDDSLLGGHGGDFLDGGEGNDILRGESGADTLVGGFGTDVLDGGTDNADDNDDPRERDLASYAAFSQQVSVDLAAGTATHSGPLPLIPGEAPAAEADQLIAIEDVLGGSGDDLLAGDDGRNRLFGGGGNDTLRGLAGKDTLFAGAGDDLLEGGDDTDWLFGPLATSSAGRARLVGGGGFDWGISNDDEERDSLERWFTSVDDFVNSIA